MKRGGAGCRRLCRAGRRGERREGETEGGMEPCWENRPVATVQAACIGGCRGCDAGNAWATIFSNKTLTSQSLQSLFRRAHRLLFTTCSCSATRFQIRFMDTWVIALKFPFGWCGNLVQAVSFATRANHVDRQTDRQTDKSTEPSKEREDDERRRRKKKQKKKLSGKPFG